LQGGTTDDRTALAAGVLDQAKVDERERVLLEFVGLVTQSAWKTRPADVERVRGAGWTDEQIAEAVYVTALFALFNRVADAFGLAEPPGSAFVPAPPDSPDAR
jgi:alkylhydroperoxidase family enzyme